MGRRWASGPNPGWNRGFFVEASVKGTGCDLLDFNIRACDGRLAFGTVMGNCKTASQWIAYLDLEGNKICGFNAPDGCSVPGLVEFEGFFDAYRLALNFTRDLSSGMDYARYDFLWNGRELYGGEITVYPSSGTSNPPHPALSRSIMESWDLGRSHFLQTRQSGWRWVYAGVLRREMTRRKAGI
ncbi:MAG: hypothetical protein SFU85_12075 [Candidatus Methylacidiphilales bacterium]|nr:hypothetical protein [Candidatus Methylacidiphilales bacterium]